jgi:PEP-CTERM motif
MRSRLQLLYVCLSVLLITSFVHAGTAYNIGDPFASVGSSTVNEFTPTGTLVQTLDDTSGSTFTTGSAFDSPGNFYVTNFSTGTVSQFDGSGNLLNVSFATPPPGGLVESISFAKNGDFYVGGQGANIQEFSPTGALIATFNVTGGNGTGRTDWIDLQADQSTILYDGEGNNILSFNTATSTQNPDFVDSLPGPIFALRALSNGDVLVADSANALELGPTGTILQTYTLPGNLGGDFALNLDPNGTDFWTGDDVSGLIWEVNIATGAIDNQFSSNAPGSLFGLSVFGQITQGAGGGPPTVPEPASVFLLGGGIAAARLAQWLKQKKFRA